MVNSLFLLTFAVKRVRSTLPDDSYEKNIFAFYSYFPVAWYLFSGQGEPYIWW